MTDIYEKVDENTAYQELTEVKTAKQDIYDELKWTQLHVEEVENISTKILFSLTIALHFVV